MPIILTIGDMRASNPVKARALKDPRKKRTVHQQGNRGCCFRVVARGGVGIQALSSAGGESFSLSDDV